MNAIARCVLQIVVLPLIAASAAFAHPGSGIVVDHLRQVYFVDTGFGLWQIDARGKLRPYGGPAHHWMTIDHRGRFARVRLPESIRRDVAVVGAQPALILGGDFPLAVGADGALYYPKAGGNGAVHVMRLEPSADPTILATLPDAFETGPDGRLLRAQWIHGLASARDGSLYYSERAAVRRIDPRGSVSTVAENVVVPDCRRPPAITEPRLEPGLRGLDVDHDGTVYVAASACSAVLKITSGGGVSVALRASDAWSPTGVAVVALDQYVLEYRHISGGPRDWRPRVRHVARDGAVRVLAAVNRP